MAAPQTVLILIENFERIRLTAGNRAVVEDKPEVKKAGGVFYTPAYIVQYIVEHTVGKLLEGKSVKSAKGISILDPACGSGSFLIGAYQYLLDWYLARYVEEGAEKHGKGKEARLRPFAQKEWRLTTAKTPQDTTLLQRQIAATDKQIDQLVYALYGLTDDEIALVEEAA